VVQSGEKLLDLPTTNVRIEQAKRRDAAEASVWSTQPSARPFEAPKRGGSHVRDIGNTIKSIGLHWRQQALMLPAGECPRWNSNDRTNIADVPPEGPSENFEGGVGQTVTNSFNEVRAFRDDSEDLAAAKKVGETMSGGCHVAVIVSPNGRQRNVMANEKECGFPDDQREVVVRKVGRRVILKPVDAWSEQFLACIGAWSDDIPRPKSGSITDVEDPFA
jgi:hypothetical protein